VYRNDGEIETRIDNHLMAGFVAFGVGILAGGVAALLVTPASGRDLRRKIADGTRHTMDRVKRSAVHAGDVIRDQRDRIGGALRAGHDHYMDREADRMRSRA
jgi:gas vesicle protein